MKKRYSSIDWTLLSRYASGQANLKEQQELQDWLKTKPENGQILHQVVKIFEADSKLSISERYQSYDVDKAFELFKQRIRVNHPGIKVQGVHRYISVAAVILLLVGAFIYFSGAYKDIFLRSLPNSRNTSSGIMAWYKYTAPPGSVMNIDLGDGTFVRLSPGSTIHYPESFGLKDRVVKLEGEAYFDVARDVNHPFIVRTGKFSTRVLGTSFNIEAYSHLAFSRITLLTGKIAVSRNAELNQSDTVMAILTPNESITLSNDDTAFSISRIKTERADAIKGGELIFDSASMKEVAFKIGLYYNLKAQLESPEIEHIAFTGTFEHIPINELIEIIAEATGLRIEQDGNVVAISLPK